MKAFAQGDYAEAARQFQAALPLADAVIEAVLVDELLGMEL